MARIKMLRVPPRDVPPGQRSYQMKTHQRRRAGSGHRASECDKMLESKCASKKEMVLLEGETLNSLFQELADWEHQLKAIEHDIPGEIDSGIGGLEP